MVQLLTGLRILAIATILLRERHGGIGEVSFERSATIRGSKSPGQNTNGFIVTSDRTFIVPFLVGLAACIKELFCLSHFLRPSLDFPLGEVVLRANDCGCKGEKTEGKG